MRLSSFGFMESVNRQILKLLLGFISFLGRCPLLVDGYPSTTTIRYANSVFITFYFSLVYHKFTLLLVAYD